MFVSSPQSGLTVSNQLITLSGTAFDPEGNSSGLKEVLVNQNGCSGSPASGTANWNEPVLLQPGLNTLQVTAVDEAGNISPPVTIQLVYLVQNPANDFFAEAIPLTGASGSVTADTTQATKEVGEPNHAGNFGGKSVWWDFRAPQDGVLTLNTLGSSFDTVLALYTGPVVSNLTSVAANDDAFPGAPGGYSLINQAVRSNILYHVALDGYGGASGTGVVTYAFAPMPLYRVTTTTDGNGTAQLIATNSLGGASFLPGPAADFAGGTKVTLQGNPNSAYQFGQWTGDVASTANPLNLTVTSNLNIAAEFTPVIFSDGFESGDLSRLGWTTSGDAPWFVQTNIVDTGRYSARSGVILDSQSSSLSLTTNFAAGPASFDYKVSSEPSFDNLTFYIDGLAQQIWSGNVGWATYQFSTPLGQPYPDLDLRQGSDAQPGVGCRIPRRHQPALCRSQGQHDPRSPAIRAYAGWVLRARSHRPGQSAIYLAGLDRLRELAECLDHDGFRRRLYPLSEPDEPRHPGPILPRGFALTGIQFVSA